VEFDRQVAYDEGFHFRLPFDDITKQIWLIDVETSLSWF